MLRSGFYINLYGENLEYDAYVIFGEAADEFTTEELNRIENALTPILEKKWSKPERRRRCEMELEKLEDTIENLGWGYEVIIVR